MSARANAGEPGRRQLLRGGAAMLGFAALAACAGPAPPPEIEPEIAGLTQEISRMGQGVDPEEAARAARIAVVYSRHLARAYRVTDSPLVHNTKVNLGLRPRGLCWQWADDLEARLEQERFETLALHRAIANADNSFRIDHSTVIVSRRGDGLYDGVVLDPWRYGGTLFWAPVPADRAYVWVARKDVFAERARRTEPL